MRIAAWAWACAAVVALATAGCAEDDCPFPGQGWLTYTTRRAGQFDVRAVRADGACDRAISDRAEDEIDASFSVAEASSVYWAFRNGRGRIAVRYAGLERLLDTGDLTVAGPQVSPDGRWIAFSGAVPPAAPDIYVIPFRGGAPVAVAPSASSDYEPAWSADSSLLYFNSNRSGRYQVWRAPIDGGPPEQVSTDATSPLVCGATACRILGRPSPSPDGQYVAFARATPTTEGRVVIRTLSTGEERILADAVDVEPSWSPDGAEIAVMNTSFGDAEVVVRDATTGVLLRRLTFSPGVDGSPSFAR